MELKLRFFLSNTRKRVFKYTWLGLWITAVAKKAGIFVGSWYPANQNWLRHNLKHNKTNIRRTKQRLQFSTPLSLIVCVAHCWTDSWELVPLKKSDWLRCASGGHLDLSPGQIHSRIFKKQPMSQAGSFCPSHPLLSNLL